MSRQPNKTAHLAIDLGGGSGRAILGVVKKIRNRKKVELHELHRFEHAPVETPTGPVWELTGIWKNILEGLRQSAVFCRENDLEFVSVGVDTWGVDWALLGKSGELLSLPHCYRDPQNDSAAKKLLKKAGGVETIYQKTGIQHMAINTLFQVAARFDKEPELFDAARHLVFMPDLFHFWLSGEIKVERTIASTSSMLSINSGKWATRFLKKLELPTHMLSSIIDPGTEVGTLLPSIADLTEAPEELKVIAPASHDTAAAVAAVPVKTEEPWAYLSSGTWSLLGAELTEPIVNEEACQIPFTNELGVDRTVRFLKNISGLWLVQELRRELNSKSEEQYDFEQLMEAAALATPYRTIVDPNSAEFLQPGNMVGKLKFFAAETDQPEPETVGDLARCCLDSLALCYSDTLAALERMIGKRVSVLHIVGGGSQNTLLNQVTANCISRPVVCGPVESTAMGNVLVQAMGCGYIDDLDELRATVCNSTETTTVEPEEISASEVAGEKFRRLVFANA